MLVFGEVELNKKQKMHLTKQDILDSDRIKRLNMINSLTGIKPGNIVGSISNDGKTNLAIISSVVHLSSKPGLIGFIMRPHGEVKKEILIIIFVRTAILQLIIFRPAMLNKLTILQPNSILTFLNSIDVALRNNILRVSRLHLLRKVTLKWALN